MTSVRIKRGAVTFFAVVTVVLAAARPEVRAATRVGVELSAANAAAGGRGGATVFARRLHQGLDAALTVVVRKLDSSTTYEVTVGGVRVGTLTTNAAGNGRARFRTRPRAQDQFLGVDPRAKTIGVRAPAGVDEHRIAMTMTGFGAACSTRTKTRTTASSSALTGARPGTA